jgi:NADH-quinone oxidoreductase subunit I
MLHEKGRLGAWLESVPPPVALDEHAEEPKEIALAQKAAAKKQAALDAAAEPPAQQGSAE